MLKSKKLSNSRIAIALVVSVLIILSILTFTPFGVFIVFDAVGGFRGTDNFNTTAKQSPVAPTHTLSAPKIITMPNHIEQVSGIVVTGDEIVLSTDQAELFFLNEDGTEVIDGGNLLKWTPLLFRQGSIEAVTRLGNEYWLVGERGAFVTANLKGERLPDQAMPDVVASEEITGFTVGNESLYFTKDNSSDLIVIDRKSGNSKTLTLNYNDSTEAFQEFLWSGISYEGNTLFIIAENYPVVVVANPQTGEVISVLGIDGIHEFSDISVQNGKIYLPSDHNYFDKRPPLRIYQLPSGFEYAFR